jgi:hypothetical protein
MYCDTSVGQNTTNNFSSIKCTYDCCPITETGSNNFINVKKLEVFPNPAFTHIYTHFHLTHGREVAVYINDGNGKVIYTESVVGLSGFNEFHKNIHDIAAGVYYIGIIPLDENYRFGALFIKFENIDYRTSLPKAN